MGCHCRGVHPGKAPMTDDNLTPRPVDDDAQQAAEPSAADAIDLNEMEEAPQTPEEIAAIEAADKQRARNINKIFAAMMTTLVLIFVLFLAIYIPWRKDQNQLPGATTSTVQVVTPSSSAPVQ